MGFCSEECFEKAKKDLMIKNVEWDEFDYQAARDAIKEDPSLFEGLQKNIEKHLIE